MHAQNQIKTNQVTKNMNSIFVNQKVNIILGYCLLKIYPKGPKLASLVLIHPQFNYIKIKLLMMAVKFYIVC